MRIGFCTSISLLFLTAVCAQDVAPPLVWQAPFAKVSGANESSKLVFLLITNDIDLEESDVGTRAKQLCWCKSDFELSFRRMLKQRPDLADNYVLEHLPAGMPLELTGGKNTNQLARSILAVCDSQHRLLSLSVGVPTENQLLTLLEDAQNVASLMEFGNDRKQISLAVAEQSKSRVTRIWRDALDELLIAINMNEGGKANAEHDSNITDSVVVILSSVYFADTKVRFGLSDVSDLKRLIVLEQHPETRANWCETAIPFLAAANVQDIWRPLTESIWGRPPIQFQGGKTDELVRWYDTQNDITAFALVIQPSFMKSKSQWPPIDLGSQAAKRGVAWKDLHSLVTKLPAMSVDTQQLFELIRIKDLQALELWSPTQARYLIIVPKTRMPWIIREGDVPVKHIARLRKLVKKK